MSVKRPTWLVVVRHPDGGIGTIGLESVTVVRREVARHRRRGSVVAVINADAALDAGVDEFAAWDTARRVARSGDEAMGGER